ncbi:MAG: hypothetical protein BHV68_19850 [Bacteroidales bacterium 43_8]|nr:MAG: hypothetical protein BHV68_19850 [Bacteroidales bacterium 43_8]
MKQFIYTLSTVVFFLLANACTEATIFMGDGGNEGKGDMEEGVPLNVKNLGLSVEIESRSITTGGAVASPVNPNPLMQVGVSVTKANGSAYASGIRTQVFVYNAAAVSPGWELAEGEERLLLFSEKGTVNGYAPAEKSVSLSGTPKVPVMSGVKVLDKQKFYFSDTSDPVDASTDIQWETDQDDYLYCKVPVEVDRWHPEVSLTMNHALVKVSFRVLEVNAGSSFAGCRVAKIVLKSKGGFKKSVVAQLNLATGETTGAITPVDQLQFTAGGDKRVVGTGTEKTSESDVGISLELTLDDGRTFYMVPGADSDVPGTFTASWEKGYNYIYNIRMSPQGIEIADVKVAGWNDGGSVDIPVE